MDSHGYVSTGTAGELSFSQYLNATRNRDGGLEREEWASKRTRSLVRKLQVLGCPYLEGMEGAVISEVIFSPGEARLRVLTWLTGRIHRTFQAEIAACSSTNPIATIPKLADLLHDVGLCQKEDHELIKGTTSASKQLHLWEGVVDLATMATWDPGTLNSFPWQMEKCCHFVDDLCRHDDLGVVFPSSVSLIPPGISVVAEKRGVVSLAKGTAASQPNRTTHPTISELSKKCEELRSQLEAKQLQLEVALETHTYAELQPDVLQSCHKMLSVSLGTLAQLSVSFCHTYEAEIQPWCNRKAPPLTPLGPLCKRIHNLKSEIDKLFKALEVCETSYSKLDELKTSDKHWNRDDICCSAHQTLKECLTLLTSS